MNDSAIGNIHLLATVFMVGLIWFIQIVHYPMLADVGEADFVRYEQIHQQRTTWVVMPVMFVELAMAGWLALSRPAGMPNWMPVSALALLIAIWATTLFVSVPCHTQLSQGFDAVIHRRLVSTNWIRTLAWTARGLLAMWMMRKI